jgi:hypothetical protein
VFDKNRPALSHLAKPPMPTEVTMLNIHGIFRVALLFGLAAVAVLVAACESAPLDVPSFSDESVDYGTWGASLQAEEPVTDDELINAAEAGSELVGSNTAIQYWIADLEARASNAGVDLDLLSEDEQENLQHLVGYSDSEWDNLMTILHNEVANIFAHVPQLTWESYEDKAEEVLSGGCGDGGDGSGGGRLDPGETGIESLDSESSRSDCLSAAAWFVGAGFATGLAATGCGSGNIWLCGSFLYGTRSMVRLGQEAWNQCTNSGGGPITEPAPIGP